MRSRLVFSLLPLLVAAGLSSGCSQTSDGTIVVAGLDELTDFSALTDFSDFPLLAPARPRPAAAQPAAFPPAPMERQRQLAAAERPTVARKGAAASSGRRAGPTQSRRGRAAPRQDAASRRPAEIRQPASADGTARLVVCNDPVVEGGRYKVSCN